jgi:hypothetical protein
MTARVWTEQEVRALGVTTDLVTAGSVLGLSRNVSYRLASQGGFPVPVLQLGERKRVSVVELLRVLGLEPPIATRPPLPALRAVQ